MRVEVVGIVGDRLLVCSDRRVDARATLGALRPIFVANANLGERVDGEKRKQEGDCSHWHIA